MPEFASKRRPMLRQGLDRDVDAVITKIEAASDNTLKTIHQAYDAIKRSNSRLSREKRRPLEDAIDRVLQFRKAEAQDSEDSDAAIEEAEAQLPKKPEEERYLLNRQLTKHWHTKPADTASNSEEQRPKKKRRVQEDGDDRQSGGEKVNGEKEKSAPAKKPQRPSRFSVETPSNSFSLGGIAYLQSELHYILRGLLFRPLEGELEELRAKGILLTGPQGVGKRSLVRALAGRLGVPVVSIQDCFEDSERIEKSLVEAFDEAMRLAPCIILAEEVEHYMSRHGSAIHTDHHEKALKCFLRQRERMNRELSPEMSVVFMGTSSLPTDLHSKLCLGNIFSPTFQIRVPDLEARTDISRVLTRGRIHLDDSHLHDLAKMTHGFVALDFVNLLQQAVTLRMAKEERKCQSEMAFDTPIDDENSIQARTTVTFDDIKDTLKDYIPSLRKEGFTEVPKVTWENIGAMVEARKRLDRAIVGPIKHPQLYEKLSLGKSAGVMLWGPPGCGKTLIAQAVANEAQSSFILVNGPELLNKYVGESEKAVRELFQRARSSTPCVLFFDEMDSLVPKRDGASSDAGVRVVNALLTEMDGVQDRSGIYIIGTTNRPDMIDAAMLRPGRLSVNIFVDLPTEDERVAILRTIFRNRQPDTTPAAAARIEGVARDARCKGFSGADLSGLYYAAADNTLERWQEDGCASEEMAAADWEAALQVTKPSVRNPKQYADILRNLERGV